MNRCYYFTGAATKNYYSTKSDFSQMIKKKLTFWLSILKYLNTLFRFSFDKNLITILMNVLFKESNPTSKLSGCETDSLVKEAVSYPDHTPVTNMTHEHQGEIADTDRRR